MSEQAEPAKALGRLRSTHVLEQRRRAGVHTRPAVVPPGLAIDRVLIPQLVDEHRTHRARRAGPQCNGMTAMGEWISPVLRGIPAMAIDGEVHGSSDGVLH
jgi:hypothetical protein